MRFIRALRAPGSRNRTFLTTAELSQAEDKLIQMVQKEKFSEEIAVLKNNRALKNSSRLRSLDLDLIIRGILRVGGRLRYSNCLTENQKFPVILPRHAIAPLIVRHVHIRILHSGIQLTLQSLREKFWMIGARNLVKTVVHRYVTCVREKARTQLMVDLSSFRTSLRRPFLRE